MSRSPQRSPRHEYELYVENEIEAYKESLSRSALLKLGDEAVAQLRDAQQLALTELVVWEEVDRIISRRLRLVSYDTWRRKRLKEQRERQRPGTLGSRTRLRARARGACSRGIARTGERRRQPRALRATWLRTAARYSR